MANASVSRRGSRESRESRDNSEPDRLLQSLKRQAVAAACDNCRVKKVKCNGARPCSYCLRRDIECIFETTVPSETPQQARKRRFDETTVRNSNFQQLWDLLAGDNEARAVAIFRRIRRGENLESLVDHLQHGGAPSSPLLSAGQRLQFKFISCLIESTATLLQVEGTASAFLANTVINIPSYDAYTPFRDRIVQLDDLGDLLTAANRPAAIHATSHHSPIISRSARGPLYWVPASPWLPGTSDQEASHLISLFLCFLNHTWRFVETDLFLRDMRSGNLASQYCSPLLVHAMMALASLNSDLSEEHFQPGHSFEKGMRYHDEAVRLSTAAMSEPSITNIQGLAILALECLLRGNDLQGEIHLSAASTLNRWLPLPVRSADMTEQESEYYVARACVWWMAVHVALTYKIGMMVGGDDTHWDSAPNLDDVLPDTEIYWIGYPFKDEPIALRANLAFRYQCVFVRLLWEATRMLIWNATELDGRREHADTLINLTERLETWYNTLPDELRLTANMPPSLYDLHVQFHCIMMALHERTYAQMFGTFGGRIVQVEHLTSIESKTLEKYLRLKALKNCYDGATLIRTFRETYGLKCVSFILLNHSVLGVFVCLNDMHANPDLRFERAAAHAGPVQDTIAALEEFFRISLATSLRWTLSHGLAATAYHTATEELHVRLPESVNTMVKIMGGIAWRSSDLGKLRSIRYPNWSMPHVNASNRVEEFGMNVMLKKWEDAGVRQPGATGDGPNTAEGSPVAE